jgi:hypothetical protein
MAHFARLNENNEVEQVIVVHNNELLDADGNESEQKGIDFCTNLLGGNWIQTSYNSNFRKRFAGKGMIYDSVKDAFYQKQPYPSWTLDESELVWLPPKERPGILWAWDEPSQEWLPPQ